MCHNFGIWSQTCHSLTTYPVNETINCPPSTLSTTNKKSLHSEEEGKGQKNYPDITNEQSIISVGLNRDVEGLLEDFVGNY